MKIKRGNEKNKAILIIVNLIISIIAFSFLVSGATDPAKALAEPDLMKKVLEETARDKIATGQIAEAKLYIDQIKLYDEKLASQLTSQLSAQNLGSSPNVLGVTGAAKAATTYYSTALKDFTLDLTDGTKILVEKGTQFTRVGEEEVFKATIGSKEVVMSAEQQAESQGEKFLGEPITVTNYPKPLGLDLGFGWGYIAQGALWAVAVYSGVQLLGGLLGLSPGTTSALANAAAGGLFIGEAAYGVLGEGGLWAQGLPGGLIGATGIGIVAGLIILELTYKETSQQIVTFECKPWEAPSGGASCEKCNNDLYPCTEYRCKSLGQNCDFKAGEGDVCVWKDPRDVNSPIIETMLDALTKDHIYNPKAIMPPQIGARIEYTKATDKCVKAFSPLTFGIKTNEPAQCKIDINSNKSAKLDSMQYYFGGSNLYSYNHTQTLRLPGPDSINAEAPELKANGIYNLYIKCKDANGNENSVPFVFNFCVEKGPDVTPPIIEGTSIANNMPVQSGLTETNLEVYVNEPSECKWSKLDLSFKNMENQMVCSQHIYEMNNLMLYKCNTKLTGLVDNKDNEFFFKCIDQPLLKGTDKENDRREMQESYKFTLKGTQPLNILSVKPENDTIKGSGNTVELYLEVETDNGYNNGDSWCSYSITGNEKDDIQMYETGTNKHKQRLDLPAGEYTYYFQCVDLGGNPDKAVTTFKVDIDTQAPVVVRVYQDGSKLKIITDEKSTCSYQNNKERKCNFKIEEGTSMTYSNSTEHFSEFQQGKTYYIKCQDVNARQPNPVDCSIIVKPETK